MIFLEAVAVVSVWKEGMVASLEGISESFYIFDAIWSLPFLLELC